jgi:hypothetical protein
MTIELSALQRITYNQRAGTRDLRYFEFDYSPMLGAENMLRPVTVGRILDARAILGSTSSCPNRWRAT